mmetsp:Transcript_16814/g.41416  ORF Transcript_16814/g.41416 Transcript_16814/m.41416 type:complete len:360 (-) Transcript_16814:687-1766(-)
MTIRFVKRFKAFCILDSSASFSLTYRVHRSIACTKQRWKMRLRLARMRASIAFFSVTMSAQRASAWALHLFNILLRIMRILFSLIRRSLKASTQPRKTPPVHPVWKWCTARWSLSAISRNSATCSAQRMNPADTAASRKRPNARFRLPRSDTMPATFTRYVRKASPSALFKNMRTALPIFSSNSRASRAEHRHFWNAAMQHELTMNAAARRILGCASALSTHDAHAADSSLCTKYRRACFTRAASSCAHAALEHQALYADARARLVKRASARSNFSRVSTRSRAWSRHIINAAVSARLTKCATAVFSLARSSSASSVNSSHRRNAPSRAACANFHSAFVIAARYVCCSMAKSAQWCTQR